MKNLWWALGGYIYDTLSEKHLNLFFEWLVALKQHPSRALNLSRDIASGTTEKHGHSQVCHIGRRGRRTSSWLIDTNLSCVFVKNTLVYIDPVIWGKSMNFELVKNTNTILVAIPARSSWLGCCHQWGIWQPLGAGTEEPRERGGTWTPGSTWRCGGLAP